MRDGIDALLLAGMAAGLVAFVLLLGFGRRVEGRAPHHRRTVALLALAVVVLFVVWLARHAA
jgi:hypothetical protein